MRPNNRSSEPVQIRFDSTPEIFATDSGGRFAFVLRNGGDEQVETGAFDEIRFVFSLWHPSTQRVIDLDHAYVELASRLHPGDDHWVKLAEIEPVVPPYNAGGTFDGWIVLPILGTSTAYELTGSGFAPRARIQIRASAYLVS
ncbi:MAG: hypothetical protein GY769_09530 [bacterium]|nr:hypothetical protein [bacterium]